MIRSLDRIGREGIEGTLEVQPRNGWFRSNAEPRVALDPVLIDAAMHLLGAWHLEQPDWTGRILLPYEVQRIDFFAPAPAVGSKLLVRGHNEQESARHFRHGLEVVDADGRLWLRMTGAGYWRFYLPFGHVNFFGPKDEYFLSRNWPEAAASGRCHFLEPPVDLKQPVLRAAGARVTMTPRELAEFHSWNGTDAELNDWFFGRMLAKDAVRAAWNEKHGEAMFPADIETELIDGRLVCRPRGEPKAEPFPPVAVAIAGGMVAAYSASAERVGIALLELSSDETDARIRAARLAVADVLGIAAEDWPVERDSRDGSLLVEQGESEVAGPDGPAQGCRRRHDLQREGTGMTMRTASELYHDLARVMATAFPDRDLPDQIGPDTRVFADLGLASIDVVVLGERLEQHYGRRLPFGPFLASLRTRGADDLALGELVTFLQQHV